MANDPTTDAEDKGPLFIPRGDGLGWTMNPERPLSYLVFFGGLAIIVLIALLLGDVIRFK